MYPLSTVAGEASLISLSKQNMIVKSLPSSRVRLQSMLLLLQMAAESLMALFQIEKKTSFDHCPRYCVHHDNLMICSSSSSSSRSRVVTAILRVLLLFATS